MCAPTRSRRRVRAPRRLGSGQCAREVPHVGARRRPQGDDADLRRLGRDLFGVWFVAGGKREGRAAQTQPGGDGTGGLSCIQFSLLLLRPARKRSVRRAALAPFGPRPRLRVRIPLNIVRRTPERCTARGIVNASRAPSVTTLKKRQIGSRTATNRFPCCDESLLHRYFVPQPVRGRCTPPDAARSLNRGA